MPGKGKTWVPVPGFQSDWLSFIQDDLIFQIPVIV
jgi:hypothetical protein